MDNIRYKYEVTASGETMVASCGLLEITARIARQAEIVYGRMKERNPEAAGEFREALTTVITDPRSPVWHGETSVKNGVDYFTIREENHAGG